MRATCLRPARCPLDAARQEDMKKLLGEVDKDNTGTVDFEGYLQARAAARRGERRRVGWRKARGCTLTRQDDGSACMRRA